MLVSFGPIGVSLERQPCSSSSSKSGESGEDGGEEADDKGSCTVLRVAEVHPDGNAAHAGVARGMILRCMGQRAAADLQLAEVRTRLIEATPEQPVRVRFAADEAEEHGGAASCADMAPPRREEAKAKAKAKPKKKKKKEKPRAAKSEL